MLPDSQPRGSWALSLPLPPRAPSRTPATPVPSCAGCSLTRLRLSEGLREHFCRYGDVRDAVVMRDRGSNKPRGACPPRQPAGAARRGAQAGGLGVQPGRREDATRTLPHPTRPGFGFVTFASPGAADAALAVRHTLCGRVVDAKRCVPREEMLQRPVAPPSAAPPARKLFVAGLSLATGDAEFREYFERYGAITESSVVQDHATGVSRGFGFVTFAIDAAADAVCDPMAIHTLGGAQLAVKRAAPKRSDLPGPASGGHGLNGGWGGNGSSEGGWPQPRQPAPPQLVLGPAYAGLAAGGGGGFNLSLAPGFSGPSAYAPPPAATAAPLGSTLFAPPQPGFGASLWAPAAPPGDPRRPAAGLLGSLSGDTAFLR